jgi:hypothetical protein
MSIAVYDREVSFQEIYQSVEKKSTLTEVNYPGVHRSDSIIFCVFDYSV